MFATVGLYLLLINFQIDSIASAPPGLKIAEGPEDLAFNTFVWAFPLALLFFSTATYSITKKLEWVISWK